MSIKVPTIEETGVLLMGDIYRGTNLSTSSQLYFLFNINSSNLNLNIDTKVAYNALVPH